MREEIQKFLTGDHEDFQDLLDGDLELNHGDYQDILAHIIRHDHDECMEILFSRDLPITKGKDIFQAWIDCANEGNLNTWALITSELLIQKKEFSLEEANFFKMGTQIIMEDMLSSKATPEKQYGSIYVLAAQLPKEIDVPSLQSCRIELLHADVDSGSVEDWKAFASKTYQNNVTFDPTTLFNI